MRLIFVIVISLLVMACVTAEDYRKKLTTWLNHSEQELVSSWGPPTSLYETGGYRYLTYSSGRNITMPGTAPSYQINSLGILTPIGGTPSTNIAVHCQTTFKIYNGKVSSFTFQGNDCR
jgi:hypothetical protein